MESWKIWKIGSVPTGLPVVWACAVATPTAEVSATTQRPCAACYRRPDEGRDLRLAAIQHRARAPFVQPLAGDRFYVRLLAEAGDLATVVCHFADKYAAGVEGTLSLSRETTDGVSDYWSAVLPVPTSRLRYFFELTDNSGETRFFNEHGF